MDETTLRKRDGEVKLLRKIISSTDDGNNAV